MSLQKTATMVSTWVAFILLTIKFIIWIMSWSIAVLSSAIDSLLDMFVSLFNYIAVANAEKNPDKKFNYGRWKIEALASLFEWIIIIASGIYIFYESIIKIITKEEISYIWPTFIVMVISVFFTWSLVYFLWKVAKKTNNLVIKSDALHYKTDLYTNAWILLALFIIHFTWFFIVDSIIWITISLFIIYSAYPLVKKWFLLLLDVSLNKQEVEKIKTILKNEKSINGYHELKTRKSWNIKFVDFHLVFSPEMKLIDAHKISDSLEEKIKQIDDKYKWKILVHMDPYDDSYEDNKS